MGHSNRCCQCRGIKQAFQSQLSAVVDSTGKRVCFTVGHLQGACTCVGEGIGKACHRDFQCTAVKYNLPSAQRGSCSSQHCATLNLRSTRIIIGGVDSQGAFTFFGQLHATRQFAPLCGVGLPGVILGAVDQHALGRNIPHQSHCVSPCIPEHDSYAILIFVVDFILLPVEGCGIPFTIRGFIGPGGGHQIRTGIIIQPEGIAIPYQIIKRYIPSSGSTCDCDICTSPVGRLTHPGKQGKGLTISNASSGIQLKRQLAGDGQGGTIQRQRSTRCVCIIHIHNKRTATG